MALQLGALREALLDAGASPDKANKAAEELASYETRLAGIETATQRPKPRQGAVLVGAPEGWRR
jgi:hypothetical protein